MKISENCKKYKIFFWIGTKAEFIKLIPVIKSLEKEKIPYLIIFTGQHTKASHVITQKFNLQGDSIFITQREKDLSNFTECLIWWFKSLYKIILFVRYNRYIFLNKILLIHGDTESTLLGVIFAKLNKMILMHIEGGLRSFSIIEPFPEELIRRIADLASDYIFCPEYKKKVVINTYYNTVKDTIELLYAKFESTREYTQREYDVVASIHRKENLYNKKRLLNIINLIYEISKNKKILLVMDRQAEHVLLKNKFFLDKIKQNNNVKISKTIEYEQFLKLVTDSEYVLTDGGSLQEETYFLNKPCFIFRNRTERNIGLGETSILYSFNISNWLYFQKNYSSFSRFSANIENIKPSEIIVKTIKNIINEEKSSIS